MKTILVLIATIAFVFAFYIARHDSDTLLMMTAIYSLSSYWLLKNLKGAVMKEKFLLKVFLILAYAILNFFVVRNAIEYGGVQIIYAIVWGVVTTALVVLKWPTKLGENGANKGRRLG